MVERHGCDSLKNITKMKQWLKCPTLKSTSLSDFA